LVQAALLAITFVVLSESGRTKLAGMTNHLVIANTVALMIIWVARMASGSIPIPFFN
jgi:hypothetical protein